MYWYQGPPVREIDPRDYFAFQKEQRRRECCRRCCECGQPLPHFHFPDAKGW